MPDPPIAVTDAISIPSFEEGALRRSSNCHAALESAQRGSVRPCLQEASDLPGRADFLKVARHS
jgi:hypothetical protein